MMGRVPLAWLQLKRERLRLFAAIAGVAFGVVLIFVQLGFQSALFESAVKFHTSLAYEIALISPKTDTLVRSKPFPRRRLFQVAGIPGVESVTPVYVGSATWRNPADLGQSRAIFVFGVDPNDRVFGWPGVADRISDLRQPDRVLFDRLSRPEFGPIEALFGSQGGVRTEVNDRRIDVVGLYAFGTSFGIDGSLLTSDLNFRRLFPDRSASHLDVGLVYLEPGADANAVRDRIVAVLAGDVEVLTREAFIAREIDYWNSATPIGFVFGFGVIMGIVVGVIIVYQILFADVQDSMKEYATLKAMGYTHRYLVGVVTRQAALLGLFGYVPALGLAWLIYREAADATNLPLLHTPERAALVLGLTLAMCCASAMLAIRKLGAAQPAEIF